MFDRLLLTALKHRQVGPVQDEVLVDELQHRHLVPGRRIHGDVAGSDRWMRVRTDGIDQVVDPSRGKSRDGAVGGHRSVVGRGQNAVDELLAHRLHRCREDVLVEDPAVPPFQPPPQALQASPSVRWPYQIAVIKVCEVGRPLSHDRNCQTMGELQHPER
jgi:hypothetical protein